MRRQWRIWAAFGLSLVLALGGMVWVTVTALRVDRAEAEARRQATLGENVRLALWRMDSALTPLIARESGHPYFAYTAFYPAERAYTRMFAEIRHGEILLPSPLLTHRAARVLLYFQFEPGGELTSPQAPQGNMRDLAEARGYVTPETIEKANARLARLKALTSPTELLSLLPRSRPSPGQAVRLGQALQSEQRDDQVRQETQPQQQKRRTSIEARARFQRAEQIYQANVDAQSGSQGQIVRKAPTAPCDIVEGVMRPIWAGEALLLARRVHIGAEDYVQGCWLDWAAIRAELLKETQELLPEASLEPMTDNAPEQAARMLATLPVQLVAGAVPELPERGWSPIRIALVIAWACVAAAVAAVGGLLVGAVSLSERRGAFVSAVTHELRTPLTTFRMYTEMLSEDMVTDEQKRRHYLKTLRSESDRLSHLVENVLAYARLERGRGRGPIETMRLGALLDRVAPRLRDRTARAGKELAVQASDEVRAAAVRAEPSVVEQILLNLVDNACKYAASAEDARIHLEAERADGAMALRVRDHGPGISADEARKLFRPFSKSAREAAHSAPGIGLGLALSRRLARDMGGDLRLDAGVAEGACFILELPLGDT